MRKYFRYKKVTPEAILPLKNLIWESRNGKGRGSSDQSPDFLCSNITFKKISLESPERGGGPGGVKKSGLVPTFSEANLMNLSLKLTVCLNNKMRV